MTAFASATNADALLFWIRPDGRFADVNEQACRALGYSREELRALSVFDVDKEFPRERWREHWRELREAGTLHFRTTHRRRDGSPCAVEVLAHYHELDGREYNCALAYPLTPERQAEHALRESEERLALALTVSGQGLFDLDLVTGKTVFNDEYARMLGYQPAELEPTPELWASWLHPDERDSILGLYEDCLSGKRSSYRAELRLRHRSGDWIWVLAAGRVLQRDATGRATRLLGTQLDITERKRFEAALQASQALLESIIEQSPLPIAIYDPSGSVVRINQATRDLFQATDDEAIRRYNMFRDEQLREQGLLSLLKSVLSQGETVRFQSRYDPVRAQFPNESRPALRLDLDSTTFPVKDANGHVTHAVSYHLDVTARKAAEARLRYHLDLEQALAEISTLMIRPDWTDLDARIDWTLERVGRLTQTDRAYLFRMAPDGTTMSNTHEWCAEGIVPQIQDAQDLRVDDYRELYARLLQGEEVAVELAGLPDGSALKAIMQEGKIRSLICVPMSWDGRLRGFIGLDAVARDRDWDAKDRRLLRMVAEIVSHTLQHMESEQALRDSARYLEDLDRISRILTRRGRDADAIRELATAILEIFQADRAYFLHPCDPEASTYRVRMEATRPEWPGVFASKPPSGLEGVEVSLDDSFRRDIRSILSCQGPSVFEHADTSDTAEIVRRSGVRSQMSIALYPQADLPWLLGIHQCSHDRHWTEAERRLFQAIAERVSDALSGHLLLEQLRASEQRYRVVFDNAHDAIIVHDFQGRIQSVNRTMLTLYGLEHPEALTVTIGDLSGPGNSSNPANDHWPRVARGETLSFEWYARRPRDGACFPVEVKLSAIRFGDLDCVLSNVRDITERKRGEAELQRYRDRLEELVGERTTALQQANADLRQAMSQLVQAEKLAALGNLVAGVAHELSTPLGNARIVASTLAEDLRVLGDAVGGGALSRSLLARFLQRAGEAVDLLERNTVRAAELIGHFKQVAVDQTSMRRRRFNLRQTLEEVLATLRPTLKHTKHRIEVSVPAELELDSYPGPLEQVVANLVANSLKHGFAGIDEGRIEIAADVPSGGQLRLRYSDDGVGIPQALQGRVFEPFFTTRLGQGGSGLGLYIVYNLVGGVLGGSVALESRPGLGATFTLTLPCVAPERQSEWSPE